MAMPTPLELECMVKDEEKSDDRCRSNRRDGRKCLLLACASAAGLGILLCIFLCRTSAAADSGEVFNSANDLCRAEDDVTAESGSGGAGDCLYDTELCYAATYSKTTVKALYELPLAALYSDHGGQKKFEASDVVIVGDYAFVVCDNSWAITKLRLPLRTFSEENVQIGNPSRVKSEDSDYEALFHYDDVFYAVRESVKTKVPPSKGKSYHAVIEELSLGEKDYTVLDQCPCEFVFEGDSKGFEGAVGMPDASGGLIVLGLCEGNYCSEKRKFEAGNGRIVVMRKEAKKKSVGDCVWKTLKVLHIPSEVRFRDYSALAVEADGRIAITSQEDSQVWIGRLLGVENGVVNSEHLQVESKRGKIYYFPRSDRCFAKYCNIEGIHFLNNDMLLAVSDKMKKGGKQDYQCLEKDQGAHIFMLP